MTEKEQQPVAPEIPTEAADKPESDNPPKNENRRGANQAERERTIAQNRQRLREIVDVVRKHDILHGITPEKLCAIIEDLGPTFIKLGQILSMRSDILPRDYCEALKKLRSNVSPMPFEQVQRVVETSYGCPMEEVFASFDEKALGSASIAQAHAAILKSGERVVVKVQREGIHEVMSRDIILLKQACKVLKYTPAGSLVDFNQVLDEMWVVAQEEMNFQTEAANLERFHALNQDVVFVTSPILYRAYTTTNVLVMERIDGMGIDEHDKLVEAGYEPENAYFECIHEMKLIVDLINKGGVAAMNYSISDTAEYGEYVSGPRILPYEQTKANMKAVLNDIQDGTFAGKWIAENKNGRCFFNSHRDALAKHPMEVIGKQLREQMLWKNDSNLDNASN